MLKIFSYDSITEDYSTTSNVIGLVPEGERTTVNNEQIFATTTASSGDNFINSRININFPS